METNIVATLGFFVVYTALVGLLTNAHITIACLAALLLVAAGSTYIFRRFIQPRLRKKRPRLF
jgi:hypothetical protein